MNGIISESSSRHSLSFSQITASIAGGVCLFAGFVAGMNVAPKMNVFHLLHQSSVDYSAMTWLQKEVNQKSFQVKVPQFTTESAVSVEFKPFQLPPAKPVRTFAKRKKRIHHESKFALLQRRYLQLLEKQNPPKDVDYRMAAQKLRESFVIAFTPKLNPIVVANQVPADSVSVKMNASSAEEAVAYANAPLREAVVAEPVEETNIETNVAPTKKALPHHSSHSHGPKKATAAIAFTKQKKQKLVVAQDEPVAEVTEVSFPAVEPTEPLNTQAVNSQPEEPAIPSSQTIITSQSSAEQIKTDEKAVEKNNLQDDEKPLLITTSKNLTPQQQMILASALLEQQAKQSLPKIPKSKAAEIPKSNHLVVVEKPESALPNTDYIAVAQTQVEHSIETPNETTTTNLITHCEVLDNHTFIRPGVDASGPQNNQVCPERKEWISKDWSGNGWVKIEGADQIPTLTRSHAPNGGATLLLDPNSLVLLAMKSGAQVAKGAGVIVGTVPEGYKIEFTGRGEETQYFESNGKKLFAILNVEPGAGVVEVQSTQDQKFSSTVFTPVLEDTVTYLDLSAPKTQNISIQVVKSGTTPDPEIAGLTVGISTQHNIQAITQSNGQAVLKNVNLVPGFPLFIDVSSRFQENASYTYRYELKKRNKNGSYLVNQVSEKNIYRWIKQIDHKLSDQSAMVLGFYDRGHLNGFKENFTTKVEPKSERLGLDPANFTILWNGKISTTDPLEGDLPRFMAVQVPEGLSQVQLLNEKKEVIQSELIPVSPRVINMVSE